MATKKKETGRRVIVGNGPYGLWYGICRASDASVIKSKAVRLYEAQNIRHWYGKNGGITSLAAKGPCGPRKNESRIGLPIKGTLLLDVKAIHDCSMEAVANFASVGQ